MLDTSLYTARTSSLSRPDNSKPATRDIRQLQRDALKELHANTETGWTRYWEVEIAKPIGNIKLCVFSPTKSD